jgi:hypothetical protein
MTQLITQELGRRSTTLLEQDLFYRLVLLHPSPKSAILVGQGGSGVV